MANVFLKKTVGSSDSVILASQAYVYGDVAGQEEVTIVPNGSALPLGFEISQTIEKVTLSGALSEFTFKKSGTTDVLVYKGTDLVATIRPQTSDDVGLDGTVLAFTSGSVTSTTLNIISATEMRIGGASGQILTTTAAAYVPATFTVTESGGVVTFAGTVPGDIDVSIAAGTATFIRGGITATTTVASITTKTIELASGQTLAINSTDATALAGTTFKGAGTLKATEGLSIAQLSTFYYSTWTGTAIYSVTDSATALLAVGAAEPITSAAAVTVTGAAAGVLSVANVTDLKALTTVDTWTYSLTDSAANLLAVGAAEPITSATAVAVTGGAAGALSVANVAALTALTTVDTWTYSLTDSAANLLAVGAAEPITSATAVAVTGGAAGALSVANVAALTALTTVDTWTYSLTDSAAAILGGAPATISNATDVLVAGGDAGKLLVADVAALAALTTDDTWTYSLTDSAAAILGGAPATISNATDVLVAGGDAGTLHVADVAALAVLTTDDTWTYSLTDSAAEIDSADASILNAATSILATGTAGGDSIDMSNNTHGPVTVGITIDLLEGDDTFVGGDGADTITGGAGADIITGGAGADVFVFASGSGNATTAIDEITDLLSGADKIKTGAAGVLSNYAELAGQDYGKTVALSAIVTAADEAFAGLGGAGTGQPKYVIADNGSTDAGDEGGTGVTAVTATFSYLIIDWNGDSTADQVIKLTGLTNLSSVDYTLIIA